MLAWSLALVVLCTSIPVDGMRVYADENALASEGSVESEISIEEQSGIEVEVEESNTTKESIESNLSLEREIGAETEESEKTEESSEAKESVETDLSHESDPSVETEVEKIDAVVENSDSYATVYEVQESPNATIQFEVSNAIVTDTETGEVVTGSAVGYQGKEYGFCIEPKEDYVVDTLKAIIIKIKADIK